MRRWLRRPGAGEKAAHRLAQLNRAFRDLRHTPLGWPDGDHDGTRSRSVAGHRIVDTIADDEVPGTVDVLRVLGPGRSRARH
ncbi:type II toxin-antitoxin system RelE/ParE family toxin [Methylobacterium sp. J-070]|nr:type II toxin-antitoxin system RelE/ParE family toxin [Methylobacterium sp. J-070]